MGAGYDVSVRLFFLYLVLEPEVCKTGGGKKKTEVSWGNPEDGLESMSVFLSKPPS